MYLHQVCHDLGCRALSLENAHDAVGDGCRLGRFLVFLHKCSNLHILNSDSLV